MQRWATPWWRRARWRSPTSSSPRRTNTRTRDRRRTVKQRCREGVDVLVWLVFFVLVFKWCCVSCSFYFYLSPFFLFLVRFIFFWSSKGQFVIHGQLYSTRQLQRNVYKALQNIRCKIFPVKKLNCFLKRTMSPSLQFMHIKGDTNVFMGYHIFTNTLIEHRIITWCWWQKSQENL